MTERAPASAPTAAVPTDVGQRPSGRGDLAGRRRRGVPPFVISVLRIEGGVIAEATAFDDDGRMFARFGLPATVDGERGGYGDATF